MLFLVLVVVFLVFFATRDCDLTTWFYSTIKRDSIEGKVVWIIGASGGIGEHIALKYASAGARLVLSARREPELQRVAEACAARRGSSSEMPLILPLDFLDFDAHHKCRDAILKQRGTIDVVVINAGRTQRAPVDMAAFDNDEPMFRLNVLAPIHVTKSVLPHMLSRRTGQFVVVSSAAGKVPAPCSSSYSGTKHALQGFFHTLRSELSHSGIETLLACPGPVASDIASNAFGALANEVGTSAQESNVSKMPTDRCAHLIVSAASHSLDESWIAHHPILLFYYVGQYAPWLMLKLSRRAGAMRVATFKSGSDINSSASFFSKSK